MLRLSTALSFVRGLSNSGELGSTLFPTMSYEYLNYSNHNEYQVNNNMLEYISIMIMTKIRKEIIRAKYRPWHTGPPYVAFETRDRHIVSLTIRCTEHSRASNSSGSPIKVTNIKVKVYFSNFILMLL